MQWYDDENINGNIIIFSNELYSRVIFYMQIKCETSRTLATLTRNKSASNLLFRLLANTISWTAITHTIIHWTLSRINGIIHTRNMHANIMVTCTFESKQNDVIAAIFTEECIVKCVWYIFRFQKKHATKPCQWLRPLTNHLQVRPSNAVSKHA